MKSVKTILGFLWLGATFYIAVSTFMNMDKGEELIADAGFYVNPQFGGGEIVNSIEREFYTLQIHQFIPDRFLVELDSGFIQIDFIYKRTPEKTIMEKIDLIDGPADDIWITVDTELNKAASRSFNEKITGLLHRDYLSTYIKPAKQNSDDALYVYKEGISLRVRVRDYGTQKDKENRGY